MKILFLLSFFLLSGCGLTYIDAPSPPASLNWKKEGYTKRMNEIAMIECGFTGNNMKREDYFAMQECMLDRGFEYSDEGWLELDPDVRYQASELCKYAVNKDYPGCKSLKTD